MRTLLIVLSLIGLVGCADLKYRFKNVEGEKSEVVMSKDWKDCYEYSAGKNSFNKCLQKKGYYVESYTE
jgi:hypothetical protein